MNYPFYRKSSLSRLFFTTIVAVMAAAALSGCSLFPSLTQTQPSTETAEPTTEASTTVPTTVPATTVPPTTVPPTTEAKKENIAVVKEQLNVRSSPSTGSRVITQLDAGDEVEVLRIEPIGTVNWAYVSSDSLNIMGWIVTDMLDMSNVTLNAGTAATPANTAGTEGTVGSGTVATAPTGTTSTTPSVNSITGSAASTGSGQKGVVIANDLNIRSSASTSGDRVGSYNYGDRISILETSNGWGRTDKGWVSLSYVYVDGNVGTNTATGTVTATQLNVRSGPGTGYDKVKSLAQGERVNILEQVKIGNDAWGYVSGGWIALQHVRLDGTGTTIVSTPSAGTATTAAAGTTGVVTSNGLNIRSAAGKTSTVVGAYAQGATVQILETTYVDGEQWGRTNDGWICMTYVRVN